MRKKLTHSTPRVPYKPAYLSGGNPEASGLSCVRLIGVQKRASATWDGGDLSVNLIFGGEVPSHPAGIPSSEDHLELAQLLPSGGQAS